MGGRSSSPASLKALWRDAFAVEMNLSSRWLDLDRIAGAGEASRPARQPHSARHRHARPAAGRWPLARDACHRSGQCRPRGRQQRAPVARSLAGQARDRGVSPRHARRQPRRAAGRRLGPARGADIRRQPRACAARAWSASSAGRRAMPCRSTPRATARSASDRRSRSRPAAWPRAMSSATCREPRFAATRDIAGRAGRSSPCCSRARSSTRAPSSRPDPASATSSTSSCTGRRAPGQRHGDPGSAKTGWRGAQTDALIRVNAGQLITASRTYRDVMMEIELKGGRLRLPLLRVAERRRLQPRARGRGGECRHAAEGNPARRDRRRFARRPSPPWQTCSAFPKHFAPTQDGRRPWCRCAWPDRCRSERAPRPPPISCSTARSTAPASSSTPGSMAAPAGWRTGPADLTALVEGADARRHSGPAGAGQIAGNAAAILSRDGCWSRPAACRPRDSRRWLRWMPAIWRSASGPSRRRGERQLG